jgi:alkylation response protein AidB-like acyl-CoA dehydrogenase
MKARLEAARYLTWKACDYFDRTGGAGTEIAVLTKIFSSEAAVQVVCDAIVRLAGAAWKSSPPAGKPTRRCG